MPQYLTVKDIMNMYKCSRTTIYNWIEKGLPVHKFGKMVRFSEKEVEEWLQTEYKKEDTKKEP